jgi:hypothetical protein
MLRFLCGMALGLSWTAHAQEPGDFVINPAILLEANTGGSGYMINGVGSPTVVYDTSRDRYIMVFEVKLPVVDENCPVGRWALGIAYSDDALVWEPEEEPLLLPEEGTFYNCVAAHPNAVFSSARDRMYVVYKAEQSLDACDEEEPSWGCDQYTGVGRLRVEFDDEGTIVDRFTPRNPILAVGQNFGWPKVVSSGSYWYLMFTRQPDAMLTRGVKLSDMAVPEEAAISPTSLVSWANDEIVNPALLCEDNPSFPLSAFFGGRSLDGPTVVSAGWGKAISATGLSWAYGEDTFFEWSDDESWRHWDVLRVGTDEYLVWFSEKDEAGQNRIRFASTTPSWDDGDVYTRICP